jgi:hypothetical protein
MAALATLAGQIIPVAHATMGMSLLQTTNAYQFLAAWVLDLLASLASISLQGLVPINARPAMQVIS